MNITAPTGKKRKFFIISSLILGFVYIILSYFVGHDAFRNIDYSALIESQKLISHHLDTPFSVLTLLGSSEITIILLGIIFLVVLIKKRHNFFGLSLFFLIFIIELAGKLFIYHPSPPTIFNRYSLEFHLPSSFVVNTNFSFPSGHVSRSTFLLVILLILITAQKLPRLNKIIAASFTILIFLFILISRIYLAEHWFSDVLGGIILGGSLATLALGFW